MLSVALLCVGKLSESHWNQAAAEYCKRLKAYCKLEVIEIAEQRLPSKPTQGDITAVLQREAAAIHAKIPQGAAVITLCIEGKTMDSQTFAHKLDTMMTGGISKICFIIGGSFGIAQQLKELSALRLSMSPMTFPHQLARVMLLEQFYRAMNLLDGGKYHK